MHLCDSTCFFSTCLCSSFIITEVTTVSIWIASSDVSSEHSWHFSGKPGTILDIQHSGFLFMADKFPSRYSMCHIHICMGLILLLYFFSHLGHVFWSTFKPLIGLIDMLSALYMRTPFFKLFPFHCLQNQCKKISGIASSCSSTISIALPL